ncbi:hypothetical protein O1M54_20135 [Streptomyces diastatochromogenes]|nr:hypothetical protein [Streptomyces diastatochromogenes]
MGVDRWVAVRVAVAASAVARPVTWAPAVCACASVCAWAARADRAPLMAWPPLIFAAGTFASTYRRAWSAVLVTVPVCCCAWAAVPETAAVAVPVTSETVSWTPVRTPSTVSVRVPVVLSVSGTDTAGVDSSSALATAEPRAQAPVTPAAITIERRMFLFMRASSPSETARGFRPEAPGRPAGPAERADLFRPRATGPWRGGRPLA